MSKRAYVRVRIESKLKIKAEKELHKLDITQTQAVNMLYKYIARKHNVPSAIKIPNAKTRKVLEEVDKGIGLRKAKNIKDFFEELKI